MGGSWNYARLRQLAHKHRTYSDMKEDQDFEKKGNKFPDCKGLFDNCPDVVDIKNPCESCKKCHFFRESAYYKQQLDDKKLELWKKMTADKPNEKTKMPEHTMSKKWKKLAL